MAAPRACAAPRAGAESVLAKSLRAAVAAVGLTGGDYDAWMLSVTDKEVREGFLPVTAAPAGGGPAAQKIVCIVRTLKGLQEAAAARGSLAARLWSTTEAEDASLLHALRERAAATAQCESGQLFSYEVDWCPEGITLANSGCYVRKVCADLYAHLADDVRQVAARQPRFTPQEREVLSHAAFARKRAAGFTGRADLLARAAALAKPGGRGAGGRLGVIYGASGSGKVRVCMVGGRLAKTQRRRSCAPELLG